MEQDPQEREIKLAAVRAAATYGNHQLGATESLWFSTRFAADSRGKSWPPQSYEEVYLPTARAALAIHRMLSIAGYQPPVGS